eukprot:scaffold1467_cov176-Cylindrotheca_fusiformis.AAC.1
MSYLLFSDLGDRYPGLVIIFERRGKHHASLIRHGPRCAYCTAPELQKHRPALMTVQSVLSCGKYFPPRSHSFGHITWKLRGQLQTKTKENTPKKISTSIVPPYNETPYPSMDFFLLLFQTSSSD